MDTRIQTISHRIIPVLMTVALIGPFAIMVAYGQADTTATTSPTAEPFPMTALIVGIVGALTPIVIWLVKKIPFGVIPKWLLPLLAGTAVPLLLDWLQSLATGNSLPMWAIPLVGLFGVGLREVLDQLKKTMQRSDN